MTMIKHSERSLRKPCVKCGKGGSNDTSTALYWYHDSESAKKQRPCPEHNHGSTEYVNWTLGDAYGNAHACVGNSTPEPVTVTEPANHVWFTPEEPAPVAAKPVTAASNGSGDPDQAATLLRQLMDTLAPSVSKGDVLNMIEAGNADFKEALLASVKATMAEAVARLTVPMSVTVTRPGKPDITIKNVHKSLRLVLTDLSAGEHVMMVGPAGTGKSTIAEQCAEALGRVYYSISLSPQTPASQLLGYMNATGDYVRSLFRNAYEHGGVFHFDEFDNGNPSILALINAALANGQMAFPDGMVKRHDDFLCAASANTYGRGADRKYVGRQAIDVATLDRFTVEYIDVDEGLETALCQMTGIDPAKADKILSYVRQLRKNADAHKLPVVFSPRASVGMCRLIQAGRSVGDAINIRVKRGLSDADWNKVNSGAVKPSF